jgi:hypothetical protein
MEVGQAVSIKHNLNLRVVTVRATTPQGQVIEGASKIVDRNTVEFTPATAAGIANVLVTGKPEKNFLKDVFDLSMRMLTGVRSVISKL